MKFLPFLGANLSCLSPDSQSKSGSGSQSRSGSWSGIQLKADPIRIRIRNTEFNHFPCCNVPYLGTVGTVMVLRKLFSFSYSLTSVRPFAAACASAVSPSASTSLILVCGSASRTVRTSVLPSFAAHIRPVIPSWIQLYSNWSKLDNQCSGSGS